jgi:tRNA(fMet)-specific endonuclease VapC
VAGIVIVDTDLLIDFLRGRGEGVALVRSLVKERALRVTAVTAFELRVGSQFSKRQDDILRLVRRRTFPLDIRSALLAGEVHAALRGSGQEIGMADCMQAGVCLRHDLPLATRNRKHFERIPALRLVDIDAEARD